jgi:hypothetical protein
MVGVRWACGLLTEVLRERRWLFGAGGLAGTTWDRALEGRQFLRYGRQQSCIGIRHLVLHTQGLTSVVTTWALVITSTVLLRSTTGEAVVVGGRSRASLPLPCTTLGEALARLFDQTYDLNDGTEDKVRVSSRRATDGQYQHRWEAFAR